MAIPVLKIPISTTDAETFIKQGDTIPKITLTFADEDVIDLTTCTINMQLYYSRTLVFTATNGNGITVVGAKVFEIDEVPAAENLLPEGVLKGDLEIQDAAGVVQTYFDIEYAITKQYTK